MMRKAIGFGLIGLGLGLMIVPDAAQGAPSPEPVLQDGGSKNKKDKRGKVAPRRKSKGGKGKRVEPAKQVEPGKKAPAPAPAPVPTPGEPDAPEKGKFRVTGKIIYGEIKGARRVATVDVKRSFAKIPSYQRIQKENIKKTKAEYHILVAKANQEFQLAVEAAALRGFVDLVVEKGGIKGGADLELVDITDTVIDIIDD